MTHDRSPPVIGAALQHDTLIALRDWIFEADRDVELQDFIGGDVLDGDWRPLAAQLRAALDGHRGRRGLHGPFLGFSIDAEDRMIADVVRRRMEQGLDVCAAVDADQMVIHSPFTTWGYNNDGPDIARTVERVHEVLGPVVRRAADQGVALVVENIEDKDPAARVALARSFDSPAVRVSLDTGHAHYAHGATGAPPVDRYVSAAGAMLAHVHLQDADGYADRHWRVGTGSILWPSVFAALAAGGAAQPRLLLEMRDPADIRPSADWLAAQGLGR